ncbi:hypothetical protein [Streptomyces sp. NBC_00470]|uniref:hypothetical protein n=1 Tax=Streptomyces sp. NBC_00470 TaxID=2975753 RepID=UPI0030DF014A
MADTKTKTDTKAPHGRDPESGEPLAPYGFKADGTPRLSKRGRTSAKPGAGAPTATRGRSAGAQRARDQRDGLLQLADALLSPAMAAASHEGVAKKIGERRAAGLAGSLVILDGYVPAYVDQVVALSQSKPGMLAWMDKLEDSAPYMGLALVTMQLVKAIGTNMLQPDPRLAEAARLKARVRAAQMAAAVEEEARRQGVSLVEEPEPVHEQAEAYEPHAAGVAV